MNENDPMLIAASSSVLMSSRWTSSSVHRPSTYTNSPSTIADAPKPLALGSVCSRDASECNLAIDYLVLGVREC
eukprot:7250933-Prymnesium_polylepis.1